MSNENNLVQDLNSGHQTHFLRRYPLHHKRLQHIRVYECIRTHAHKHTHARARMRTHVLEHTHTHTTHTHTHTHTEYVLLYTYQHIKKNQLSPEDFTDNKRLLDFHSFKSWN